MWSNQIKVENQQKFEDRFDQIDHDKDGVIKTTCIVNALEKNTSEVDVNQNIPPKIISPLGDSRAVIFKKSSCLIFALVTLNMDILLKIKE